MIKKGWNRRRLRGFARLIVGGGRLGISQVACWEDANKTNKKQAWPTAYNKKKTGMAAGSALERRTEKNKLVTGRKWQQLKNGPVLMRLRNNIPNERERNANEALRVGSI